MLLILQSILIGIIIGIIYYYAIVIAWIIIDAICFITKKTEFRMISSKKQIFDLIFPIKYIVYIIKIIFKLPNILYKYFSTLN